jgi:Tol biopolymer transport system component
VGGRARRVARGRIARRLGAALAGLLAALVVASAAAGAAHPSEIAFLHARAGALSGQVYSVADGGAVPHRLVALQARNLAWSPDGKLLAFTQWRVNGKKASYDVWLVRADGGGLRRLTRDGVSGVVTWARKRLIVTRGGALLVLSPTGKVLGRLAKPFSKADEMAWAPNGRSVALTAAGRLYTTNAHAYASREIVAPGSNATVANPSWSPNSRRIAFTMLTQRVIGQSLVESGSIWTVGADGSGARRLSGNGALDAAPTWSPDGRRIAFMRQPLRGGARARAELWVMRADGTDAHRLTSGSGSDMLPSWRH